MSGTIWETDNPARLRRQIATKAAKGAKARLREMEVGTYGEVAWPQYPPQPPAEYEHCEGAVPPAPKTARGIARQVADKHKVGVNEILSRRRSHYIVLARQETYWRVRNETTLSLPQIGRFLGGKDHTSVLWGIRQYEKKLKAGRVSPNMGGLVDNSKRSA
jgi:hypothetical protein